MESKRSSKVKPETPFIKTTGSLNIINQNVEEADTVKPTVPSSFSLSKLAGPTVVEITAENWDQIRASWGSSDSDNSNVINIGNNNEGNKKLNGVRSENMVSEFAVKNSEIDQKPEVDATNPEISVVDGQVAVRKTESEQSTDTICRICHDNPSDMPLIQPCSCKGSMGLVHQECLEHWLGESGKTSCEICGFEYILTRKPKYTGIRSLIAWIRNPTSPNDTKNLFFDLACFFVLTPLASVSAWLCVLGSQHYSTGAQPQTPGSERGHRYGNRMEEGSNSRWTSIGLLTLTVTLLSAYYIWLFVAFKYHYNVWKTWQGRNYIVQVLPIPHDKVNEGVAIASGGARDKTETGDDFILITPSDQDNSEVSSDYTLSSVVIEAQPGPNNNTDTGVTDMSSSPEVVAPEFK